MKFEIHTVVNIKILILWVVMPHSLVDRHLCFRGTLCALITWKAVLVGA